MAPLYSGDDRDYDYAGELGSLPPWNNLVLIAAITTRVSPVYQALADGSEREVYTRTVDSLWQGREIDTAVLQDWHEEILSLWPENEEEMDDLTPYYWKVRVLLALKAGLQHASDDPIRGTKKSLQTVLDLIDDFETSVYEEGIDRPIARSREEKNPYSAREFGNFLRDVDILHTETDPEAAVQRIRELSTSEAEFMRQGLLPLWIQAEEWSQADLESAHGAEQNGR